MQRTVKFAKYLPEFGWQPVVLTVSNPPLREADYSLQEELPDDLPIYRAPDIDVHYLRRTVNKFFSSNGHYSTEVGLNSSKQPSLVEGRIWKTWANFAGTWLLIPDSCIRWLPAALLVGLRLVKQCDVIYSTSAPFTNHLVAYLLHKLSGKPWIADFRDPWTQYLIYQSPSKLRARIDTFLEKHLLQTANIVTVTCASTAQGFQDTYVSLPKDKFIEITNGFDAEDFDQPVCSFNKFTIAYTGRFYSEKNTSSAFLQALKELCGKYPELTTEFRGIFAGVFGEQNQRLLKQWGLEEVIKPIGYVQHQESVKLLLQSHALLLTLSDGPGVNLTYPGKLFEYLAARKIILALVSEGATADLIRDMAAGVIVPPDDVEAIKKALLDLYNRYKQGDMLLNTYDNLQKFERRTLTERLAQCLNTAYRHRNSCE